MENNNEENNNAQTEPLSLSMEHLPEQVVSEVFQYLDTNDLNQMALTSHDWKSMTENDTLRRHMNCIEVEGKNIESHHNVTRGIKYCDNLVLKKCTISSKKFGRILKEIGEKLKSIQLIDCYFTDNHHDRIFKYIAEHCPMIESIEITSTNPEKFVIFKEADLEPLLDCPNLHTIKIDGLEHKDFRIIMKLLKKVWKFEYTFVQSYDYYTPERISYCPKRNAIYRIDYNTNAYGWKTYQILPEPKEDPNSDTEPGRINEWPQNKFTDFQGSFKMNTYEVIDINEYEKTISIMDDEGNITEDYKPSPELFQEILEEMKENEQCFISLIHIHHKNKRPPHDEISGTIENGIMNRPPYWNN